MTTQFPGSGNGQPRALTAKRKAQKILVESRGQDRGRQAEPGVVENLATRSRQDVQGQSRLIASQRKNPGGLDPMDRIKAVFTRLLAGLFYLGLKKSWLSPKLELMRAQGMAQCIVDQSQV